MRSATLYSLGWLAASGVLVFAAAASGGEASKAKAKVPVILDTDIGDDIDDTWALALLLKSPELDLKLVVSDSENTTYRAKIIAKMLEVAGRTDVGVGIGVPTGTKDGRQAEWVRDYILDRYPGKVHRDGVAAMTDLILQSPEPITLICIGPVPNIAVALKRNPEIAQRARFVGMHGSVRLGYNGNPPPDAEWNVKCDPKAAQAAFSAAWPMTITPLDTCGIVRLQGAKFRKVAECKDPVVQALVENYRIWKKAKPGEAIDSSSVLFDTVAIYLAFSTELVRMETHPLRVTPDGFTRIDPEGKRVACAMAWKDLGAFEDFLVQRLTQSP